MAKKIWSGIWAGCLVLGSVSSLKAEWLHPNMFLNPTEIQEIKARVASGKEPWKSGYAKLIRNADEGIRRRPASLKYAREIIKKEGCKGRCTNDFTAPYRMSDNEPADRSQATDAAYYLVHMALAWHLTGQEKYAEGARKQIDVWYFEDDTRMEPKYIGGDDVAGTNSFSGIVWGVDLSWPFLSAEKRAKLKDWHKAYLASLGAPVGCGDNRCYWKSTAAMMCAIIAEDPAMIARSVEMYKTAKMDDGRPGRVKDEDKDEKRYAYRMFALNGLFQIVEMARHHGLDLYNQGLVDGKSRLERSWDYYAQFTKDPSLWMKLEGKFNREDRVYNAHDKVMYEVAQAYKPKPAYEYLLSKLNQKRPFIDRGDGFTLHTSLFAVTLTHSAGTFPLKVYNREGQSMGALGTAIPTSVTPLPLRVGPEGKETGGRFYDLSGAWLGFATGSEREGRAAGARVYRSLSGQSQSLRLDLKNAR